jgi:hypothetical protein
MHLAQVRMCIGGCALCSGPHAPCYSVLLSQVRPQVFLALCHVNCVFIGRCLMDDPDLAYFSRAHVSWQELVTSFITLTWYERQLLEETRDGVEVRKLQFLRTYAHTLHVNVIAYMHTDERIQITQIYLAPVRIVELLYVILQPASEEHKFIENDYCELTSSKDLRYVCSSSVLPQLISTF